jgi:hypothetical protein
MQKSWLLITELASNVNLCNLICWAASQPMQPPARKPAGAMSRICSVDSWLDVETSVAGSFGPSGAHKLIVTGSKQVLCTSRGADILTALPSPGADDPLVLAAVRAAQVSSSDSRSTRSTSSRQQIHTRHFYARSCLVCGTVMAASGCC